MWKLFVAIPLLMVCGCGEPYQPPPSKRLHGADLTTGAVATIEPFNPDAGEKIVPLEKVGADDPNSPYGQMWSEIDPKDAIEAYKQDTGEYPKNVKEFIEEVVIPNDITFPPIIAPGLSLRYYEAEHRLILVSGAKPKPATDTQDKSE